MRQKRPLLGLAVAALIMTACTKPLSVDQAKAQLRPYEQAYEHSYLCDASKRQEFETFIRDYARAMQASGKPWPDLTGEEKSPDWVTRAALTARFANLIDASAFSQQKGAKAKLTPLGIGQAKCSTWGPPDVKPSTTKLIYGVAARAACPELVRYTRALAVEEYAEIYRMRQLTRNGSNPADHDNVVIENASSRRSWETIAESEETMLQKMRETDPRAPTIFTACGMRSAR